jgi:hypothetical protein
MLSLDRHEPDVRAPRWERRRPRARALTARRRNPVRWLESPTVQVRCLYLVSAALAGALLYLVATWPSPRPPAVLLSPLPLQSAPVAPVATQGVAPVQPSASTAGTLMAQSVRALDAAARNARLTHAILPPTAPRTISAPAAASVNAGTRTTSLPSSPAPIVAAPRQSATTAVTSSQGNPGLDRPGPVAPPSGTGANPLTGGSGGTTPASASRPAPNHIVVPATVPSTVSPR